MANFPGTSGNDFIEGTTGDDIFDLTLGNDTLIGGLGQDKLTNFDSFISAGNMTIDLEQGTATGTNFSQTITGFENVSYEAYDGTSTYTTILGNAEDNDLRLSLWSGLLDGGAGNDSLTFDFISSGTLRGGDGDDEFRLYSSRGGTLEGGNGIDTLHIGDAPEDVVVTRNASDQLFISWIDGDSANVTLLDRIEFFEFSTDSGYITLDYETFIQPFAAVTGTENSEVLISTSQDEDISGLGGNDWIIASYGADRIDGGAGNDTLSFVGPTGVSSVIANLETGNAWINGSTALHNLPKATQKVTNVENLTGTSRNDHISGDDGANHLRGLGGRDIFTGSAGGDLIDGGAGTDFLINNNTLPDSESDVSLLRGRIWEGQGAGTRLVNIENVIGGNLDDRLTGDHGNNKLDGSYGNDTLMGNGGNDLIYGGVGNDIAVFGFEQDQYEVTQSGVVTQVAYIGAGDGDGTDRLLSIEVLRFTDGDVIL